MRFLIAIAVLMALARVEASVRWRALDPLRWKWRRLKPRIAAYVRAAPGTFLYLFALLVTTWVLHGSSPRVQRLLLLERSTNLRQMRQDPIRVLFASAFWLDRPRLLLWAVLFTLVLAPVEQWLGTSRWAGIFAAGHVGATLATVAGISAGIRWHALDPSLAHTIDVGVSYGFASVAAILTFRLPRRWRRPYTLALIAYGVFGLWHGGTFTDAGHLIAVVIGYGLYPLTKGKSRPKPFIPDAGAGEATA